MTSIIGVVKDDRIILAGERRISANDFIAGELVKVRSFRNLDVACAGDVTALNLFFNYAEYFMPDIGEDKDEYFSLLSYLHDFEQVMLDHLRTNDLPNYGMLIVFQKNLYSYDTVNLLYKVDKFAALGNGGIYSLCALKLGKSPKQAIKFAIDNCITCGGEIDMITVLK